MNKVILIIFSISIFLIPRPTLAYTVCAILESGFSVGTLNEDCAGIGVANSTAIKEEVANNAPRFTGYNLPRGNIGQSYIAYLQAEDPDRNEVAWSINVGGNSCTNNIKCGSIGDTNCQGTWASEHRWGSWESFGWTTMPSPIVAAKTIVSNQRKIAFGKAGRDSKCFFSATVSDGSSETTQPFYIISTSNPTIVETTPNYIYTAGQPFFKYSLKAFSSDPAVYPLSLKNANNSDYRDIESWLNNNFSRESTRPVVFNVLGSNAFVSTNNEYVYSLNIPINSDNVRIPETKTFTGKVKVLDRYGNYSEMEQSIKIVNTAPSLNKSSCEKNINYGNYFSCNLSASDPEGNAYDIGASGLPSGIELKKVKEIEVTDLNKLKCVPGFHLEKNSAGDNTCVSNFDSSSCPVPANSKGAVRYWDKTWGYCQITACDPGFTMNSNKTICAVGCSVESYENAASVEVKDGVCVVTGCNGDNHVDGSKQSCEPSTTTCAITNGTSEKTWTGSEWSPCVGNANSCTQGNYPIYDSYRNACINACGSLDINELIDFNIGGSNSSVSGYLKNMKFEILDAYGSKINGSVLDKNGNTVIANTVVYVSGTCGSNIFKASVPVNRFIKDNVCMFTKDLAIMKDAPKVMLDGSNDYVFTDVALMPTGSCVQGPPVYLLYYMKNTFTKTSMIKDGRWSSSWKVRMPSGLPNQSGFESKTICYSNYTNSFCDSYEGTAP